MFCLKKIVFFVYVLCLVLLAEAQENLQTSLIGPVSDTIESLDFFANEEPLQLTLKYDITSFIKQKYKGEYLDALLTIHLNENDSIVKNIRLKARGNFRRGHCFFPPIYLNFKTDPIRNGELAGIKKIKLVTHCSASKAYQGYVLKEYLAYKMYNLLSEYSFRVKLLDINYIDTGKKERNYERQGFLIEPVELLEKRTNAVEIEGEMISGLTVLGPETDIVSVFEYMIANTDWRVKGGHNMKYLKSLDRITTRVIPVPYDFDYSGLVDAHYAIPQEWTTIKEVTDREYLGFCRDEEEAYLQAIEPFVENKDGFFRLIKDCQYLSEKDKKRLKAFIEDFFDEAEDQKGIINTFKNQCRDITF